MRQKELNNSMKKKLEDHHIEPVNIPPPSDEHREQ
jgi:hypothetical protein